MLLTGGGADERREKSSDTGWDHTENHRHGKRGGKTMPRPKKDGTHISLFLD